jgi:hypothetical protein
MGGEKFFVFQDLDKAIRPGKVISIKRGMVKVGGIVARTSGGESICSLYKIDE